ncbi:hypothetical protein [Acinetobacter sp. NBRC 100985]|uniref:hypothetical protein n=1 Tax=Acinetobacter sp. NBRC 100985 TaxID=1071390 RepID=UPI000235FA20|nr:hypothetical protein [Acinetobacter sp. NBRC 100985]GAB03215.1 hypothetical protein ACT4_053_00150 [Acinetobacter sp. NBRC 100985]
MYITKVLSYNGAWEKLLAEHGAEFDEIKKLLESYDLSHLRIIKSNEEILDSLLSISSDFEDKLEENEWENLIKKNNKEYKNTPGLVKNKVSFKFQINHDILTSFIFRRLKLAEINLINEVDLAILLNLNESVVDKSVNWSGIFSYWENNIEELKLIAPISLKIPFLILGIGFEPEEIEVIELERQKEPIMIERSIEFKPEHYQAGLGILNYFGTVMRKKYPEQNAKVRIEQDDNAVRLVVESANGDKEVIERAFDEFGLVIHRDIQPEEFYDNYLDVAELKTKLGTFESELKFQHQLVEMKEHRIIELKKDKEFLENLIGQALVRPNSPIYINNQLTNSQSTVINHKAEISKSNDDLEELIDLADSDALKNKLAMIQNALENNRNSDNPEDIKDSNGMKKLAKFLKEANEVGTEANSLAEKGGKALELIKSLGRSYNSIAQWCGMPIIPNVFVKE